MTDRPLSGEIVLRASVEYFVRPVRDREELRRMLAPFRPYAAYALGPLQGHLFRETDWWVARGAHGQALLLHARGGLGHALFTLGTAEALEALLRLHPGPRHTFLTCQTHHLPVVTRHFRLAEQQQMLRMLVDRASFRPIDTASVDSAVEVRRLTGRDAYYLNRLYWTDGAPAAYSARNLNDAVYYGAFVDGRLAAAAGTHVVTPVDAIAVVGNVFTHPAYRGRGLGTLVTSAVTEHLLRVCQDVVLSVDPRNTPAVAAYRRLGYREVGRLVEGGATRRDLGLGAFLRRRLAALRGRRYGAELISITV
jgi:ribosomal protein S18 acetylase RimI-like enzyme